MSHDDRSADTTPPRSQRTPWQQIFMDDIFLLLAAGLVVPTLFYIVWGLMDLASVPVFRP